MERFAALVKLKIFVYRLEKKKKKHIQPRCPALILVRLNRTQVADLDSRSVRGEIESGRENDHILLLFFFFERRVDSRDVTLMVTLQ